jgi:hypothetical protein
MIELIATIVITLSSAYLFAYWFRYSCLLILSAKTAQNYEFRVAADHGLSFIGIQLQLRQAADADLDRLRDSLDRDYAVIERLLRQVDSSAIGIEGRMLAIHYRITRSWYQVTHQFSTRSAREALDGMAAVVAYFANSIGEAAASPSAA